MPELREWANMMTKIASYEMMLDKINGGKRKVAPSWIYFWNHITVTSS